MAWVPAAISAAGSLAGGLLGSSGAAAANATNYKIWTESKNWQTMMANTEVQRRVGDLKNAGLNPMLAYSDSASSPNVPAPRMENEKVALAASAAQIAAITADAKLKSAQAENVEKDTYLKGTTAENTSAQTTLVRQQYLKTEADRLNVEALTAGIHTENDLKKLNLEQQRRLMPLMLKYQEIQNELLHMGIAGAKNAEQFEKDYPNFSRFMDLFRGAADTGRSFRH